MLNVANQNFFFFLSNFHRIFYFDMPLLMGPEMKHMKEAKQTIACYLGS